MFDKSSDELPLDPLSKAMARARSDRGERPSHENNSVRQWVSPASRIKTNLGSRQLKVEAIEVPLDNEHLHAHNILRGLDFEEPKLIDKYRLLRTRVLQAMKYNNWNSLGITSPGPKVGKSVTAINLAISIARESDNRVALIDCDIRRPTIGAYLGISNEEGIVDYINGDVELHRVCYELKGLDNLTVMPGNVSSSNIQGLKEFHSNGLFKVLSEFPNAVGANITIVDLPPVSVGDDVIAVAPNIDSLMLVVDETSTQIQDLQATLELLEPYSILGTVLNMSAEKERADYSYYAADNKS